MFYNIIDFSYNTEFNIKVNHETLIDSVQYSIGEYYNQNTS